MPQDKTITRPEPCIQCGKPVTQVIRSFTANGGQVVKQSVISTECTGDCVGQV
jgi:hypothetical protein